MNLAIYLTIKYDYVCSGKYIDDQKIYNRETCKFLRCHQIGKHKHAIRRFFAVFLILFSISVDKISVGHMVKIGVNKIKQKTELLSPALVLQLLVVMILPTERSYTAMGLVPLSDEFLMNLYMADPFLAILAQ